MSFLDTVKELMSGNGPKTDDSKYREAKSELLAYDIGRTAYFDVEFYFNKFADNDTLRYVCHSAELPGESTATVHQKIYGVTEQHSVMTGYKDIDLSFYTRGSQYEKTRKFFQNWIAYITGREETIKNSGIETTYNVRYKSEYASRIKITHYAITGMPLVEVTLIDAFPISINQIPLSWAAQNEAQSLNVAFAYTEYTYDFKHVESNGAYTRGPLGELLGTAIKTASTINTINGAIESGNPLAIGSTLPGLGLSNFTLSSGLTRIGL
jgi:hypothetical protein